MSRLGEISINGKTYDFDDLTLNEMEQVEDACGGIPFSEINYGGTKAMKAIAYTLLRRDEPEITMEEIGNLKVLAFMQPDEEMPELPPEHGDDEVSQSELEPDGSGHPLSVASIAG